MVKIDVSRTWDFWRLGVFGVFVAHLVEGFWWGFLVVLIYQFIW